MLYSSFPAQSLTDMTISCIRDHMVVEAQFALSLLTPNDDLLAVSQALIQHPHTGLWRIYFENKRIENAIEPCLSAMYSHAQVIADSTAFDPTWDEIVVELQQARKRIYDKCSTLYDVYNKAKEWQDAKTQQEILGVLTDFSQLTNIVEDLASSYQPSLWTTLLENVSLKGALTTQHYSRLVAVLLCRAKSESDTKWVHLLTQYLMDGYPNTYQEVLLYTPEYHSAIHEYAAHRILMHCCSTEISHVQETVKWLKLLLVLSSQPTMLACLQQRNAFNMVFGHCIQHLNAEQIFQMYRLFPHQLPTVLEHTHRSLENYRTMQSYLAYRTAYDLLKKLFQVEDVRIVIQADQVFCDVLNVPCVSQLYAESTRPAPFTPNYSATVAASASTAVSSSALGQSGDAAEPSPRRRLQRQQAFHR